MKGHEHNRASKPATDRSLLAEQTALLYASIPLAAVGNLINAAILVAVQWPVVGHRALLVWLTTLAAATVLRLVLLIAYRLDTERARQPRLWARRFIAGTALGALTWGSAGILLFPAEAVPQQAFLAFVLAGISAGGVTSLSFLQTPILLFLGFILVPLAARFFVEQTPLAAAMGTLTLLFFLVVLLSARRIYESTRQNIALRMAAATREEMLRESEERYRAIFESAPLGIVHFDAEGEIVSSNDTTVQLLASTPAALAGLSLIGNGCDESLRNAVARSLAGKVGRFEGPASAFIGRSSTPLRAFFRATRDVNGNLLGGVGILVDITEDRRVQRLKNEFISTVSHELRTPLTAIKGTLALLINGIGGKVDDDGRQLLTSARQNTERLVVLINDLLDIDKIEAGQMAFVLAYLDAGELVREALALNQEVARQYEVEFVLDECAEPAPVIADHDRLIQVVTNLLSNAAKFSPPASKVSVRVTGSEDWIGIAVSDSGPGIPPEFRGLVFDRFTQHDASDARRAGGTGLGLSITKAIVTELHGRIRFASEAGKGTTFFVELPRAPNPMTAATAPMA